MRTLYLREIIIERADGATALLTYTESHSVPALLQAIRKRAPEVYEWLGERRDSGFRAPPNVQQAALIAGRHRVRYSGRTRRDAEREQQEWPSVSSISAARLMAEAAARAGGA